MSIRPALVRIEQSVGDRETRVVVTLSWKEREYLGEASGVADDDARPRLLGEATLRAVEALTGESMPLSLDAIATTDLGESRVAMAKVLRGGGDSLVGSALVSGREPAAAPVRAVLDALNRQLALHL